MLLTSSSPLPQVRVASKGRPLVILDTRVDDLAQLVKDLGAVDVFVLDPTTDGIDQITAALQERGLVSSLHLVSHGAPGRLQLGSTWLSLETLDGYAESLQAWAEILQGGDVLLYGCRVAEGALGYLFLRQLHQLTGANLAASAQPVGRIGLKRNWVLEAQVGEVQTPLIFSDQLQASYSGNFETVNFSLNTDTLIESEGTPFSFNFSVDGPIPPGGSVVRLEGSIPQAINQLNLFALNISGLSGQPVDVSPGQDFSTFEVTIVEPNASISLPVFNDFQPDSPQAITWTVTPVSQGTTVNNGSATVTIYDNPGQVPTLPPPTNPVVSITSDITTLVEDEGTSVTLTISLSEPPPAGGLPIVIETGKPFALGDFDIFPPPPQATATGGQLVAGNADNSGFTFAAQAQTATITLPIFNDADLPPGDPNATRNDDIGEEQTTFFIAPGNGYTVGSSSSVTLTLKDTNALPPPPNTPPVADDDSYNTAFDIPLTVNAADGVLNGDTDVDGDPLSAAVATNSGSGSVILNADGSFTYTPNAGFSGNDSFTYTVSDGNGGTDTATVSVAVGAAPPPLNTPPVADDDSYNTAFDIPLTVNAADGVLNGDTDADGDALSAAVATNPGSGSVTLNADGSFTYAPNAGFSGNDSFTYTVSDGNGGTDTATVSVAVGDAPPPPDSLVVGISATPTALVEEDGTVTTLTFTLSQAPPAGGINVTVDSNIPGSLAEFDVAGVSFSGAQLVGANADSSGFTVNITEQTATIALPVFDDNLDEGIEEITYALQVGDGYEPDSAANSVTLSIQDNDSVEPPLTPVVSFSTTPGVISEAEGTALVMNFSVEGDIPEGGITVNLAGDAARIMQEFIAAQVRFNPDGTPFYRFDNAFANNVNSNIVGGVLNRFSLEDGDPSESAANEAAAGTGFLSNFSFTITEANASITIPVLDDLIEEPDQTFTYTLAPGTGYTVDTNQNSGTFTLTDGVPSGAGPRVGVRATPGTLYESEQTALTLTFTTQGEIPEEGLVVFLEGPPRAIAEFDVNATNPRLPEAETVVQGPVVTGGSIVGTNEAAGGLFFRIFEPTTTITVPVFQDEVAEGPETLTFVLQDGEQYQVNPNQGSVTVTIEDTVEPPVVSLVSSTPTLLSESDGTVLELTFNTTGTIPATGTTIVLEITDPALLGTQISNPSNQGNNTGITIPGGSRQIITDADGNFVKLLQRVTITEANATLRLPVVDDLFQEADAAYTINLVEGEGYSIEAGAANSATFTVTDGVIPETVPNVGITATPGTLYESEQTAVTLSFSTRGTILEDGLVVFVESGSAAVLGEFAINGNARTGLVEGLVAVGGEIVGTDNDASGFFFRITSPTATITVPVFQDEVVEGPETFTFTLAEGEAYDVRANQGSVAVTIEDTVEPPVVSLVSSTPTLLSESDGTVLELTFNTTGTIPATGTTIVLEITDPALLGTQISNPSNQGNNTGITIPGGSRQIITDADGNFVKLLQRVTVTEANATLRLPVINDLFQEADATYTINLVEGEGYSVEAGAANSATFTVTDGEIPTPAATVGITATPTMLYESEETVVTLTFNTQGTLPEDGLVVFVESGSAAVLGEFAINGNARTGLVEGLVAVGGEIVGTDNDASGFFFRLTAPTATITVPVFQDEVVEGPETFTFTLAEGEAYDIDPVASAVTVTIDDVAPGSGGQDSGLDGQVQFDIAAGDTVTIADFNGVGLGALPTLATIDELDTIKFSGEGLTAANMQLLQNGNDLEITFLGDTTGTKAVLQNFDLENLDNLLRQTGGQVDRGNIIFSDESTFEDGFDVFNADSTQEYLWNRNSVTFLNDLDNVVRGFNNSDDVINGLGGNDTLLGLSGNDILRGGAGDDVLDGGLGDDIYTGGSGADQFVFGLDQGIDIIADFEAGIDQIKLGGLAPSNVNLSEMNSDTLVMTNSSEMLGVIQGVTGLDNSIFV